MRFGAVDWGQVVQRQDDIGVFQVSLDQLAAVIIHSLSAVPDLRHRRDSPLGASVSTS